MGWYILLMIVNFSAMNKAELIESLKQMNNQERLEVIEVASRLMREEIEDQTHKRDDQLKAIAQSALSDYSSGGSLADLWSDNLYNDY